MHRWFYASLSLTIVWVAQFFFQALFWLLRCTLVQFWLRRFVVFVILHGCFLCQMNSNWSGFSFYAYITGRIPWGNNLIIFLSFCTSCYVSREVFIFSSPLSLSSLNGFCSSIAFYIHVWNVRLLIFCRWPRPCGRRVGISDDRGAGPTSLLSTRVHQREREASQQRIVASSLHTTRMVLSTSTLNRFSIWQHCST